MARYRNFSGWQGEEIESVGGGRHPAIRASRDDMQICITTCWPLNEMTDLPWTLPKPSLVMERIEKWRNLDLRKMTDNEVDSELSEFLDSLEIYPVSTIQTYFFKLWRVRRFNYLFKDTSECWEPPPDKTPMGRCNAKGSPVLYVSEQLSTPFEELNIGFGNQFYSIKYESIGNIDLKNVVPKEIVSRDKDGKPIYDNESMLSYQILREFVRSEFLKPVGSGTEYLHKISASMCRVWFHSDDSDGWVYPSVQSPLERNVAIKSSSAKKKIKIIDLRIARLVPVNEVKQHKDRFEKHPFRPLAKIAIETDFRGEIIDNKINWIPSNDLGWI